MSNTTSKIKLTPVDMASRQKLDFKAGDTVTVWAKIVDEKGSAKGGGEDKYRLQAFEGIVLARKHGKEIGATFTVRKVASGVGVERIFPLYSPMIDRIEVTKKSRARRSKLYYIRDKVVKDIRRKMRSVVVSGEDTSGEMDEESMEEPVEDAKIEKESENTEKTETATPELVKAE